MQKTYVVPRHDTVHVTSSSKENYLWHKLSRRRVLRARFLSEARSAIYLRCVRVPNFECIWLAGFFLCANSPHSVQSWS